MTINFANLLPTLQPALESVARIPIVHYLNETIWIFAAIETGHLLLLTILGGAVLILNLRVLNLVLTDVPVEEVERTTRSWYRFGAAGAIVTGVIMGITTARTLLPNGAFFIKMVALIAAIILSHVVARQVRGSRALESRSGKAAILAGFAIWLAAMFLFATTARVNPGSILIALAGAALLSVATQRRHRPAIIAASALALSGWYVSLDALVGQSHGIGIALTSTGLVAAASFPTYSMDGRDTDKSILGKEALQRLTAFVSTLAWITVAAAGRWIGFS
ncbi:MAG: hypothetical protein QHC67_01115 [Sphingobium sp.]|uniref:DUF6644 family protein n=1 Tax=Sphingobium sp. TaxID=1912891 RepID=UPI0029AEE094|nr:DUF6644 family protein [Sphingobium sp.]MDX3908408.1 hypothetical protein [Sphingobium sp.]